MLDIAQKMRELIPLLHKGVNDVELPDVKPECEDEWSPDYAIVQDVYHCEDDHYFDEPQFYWDLKQMIATHFTTPGEHIALCNDHKVKHSPGTIVIFFDECRSAHEIEVYRVKRDGA